MASSNVRCYFKKNWHERRDRKAGIHDPYSSEENITGVADVRVIAMTGLVAQTTNDRRKECIQSLILKI